MARLLAHLPCSPRLVCWFINHSIFAPPTCFPKQALGGEFSATLVWFDYPGSPMSHVVLVNDLDLVVRSANLPDTTILGNMLSTRDSTNTVERVYRSDFPPGTVEIRVRGEHLDPSHSPQRYALVVVGQISGTMQSPNNPVGGGDGLSGACVVEVAKVSSCPAAILAEESVQFDFAAESGRASAAFECQLVDSDGEAL